MATASNSSYSLCGGFINYAIRWHCRCQRPHDLPCASRDVDTQCAVSSALEPSRRIWAAMQQIA
eukprot:6203245-Pleurochrysis_carterae.AAC.2